MMAPATTIRHLLLQLRCVALNAAHHRRSYSHFVRDHYFNYFRESDAYRQTVATRDATPRLPSTPPLPALSAVGDEHLAAAVLSSAAVSAKREHVLAVEKECCRRVGHLSPEVAIRVMDAWASIPHGAGNAYARHLLRTVDVAQLPQPHFVHLLYLLALEKCTVPVNFVASIKRRLPEFQREQDFKEMAIVCSSLFKLKIKVLDEAFLNNIARHTSGALKSSKDRFDIIATLKFLRLCQHYNADLLENVARYAIDHCQELVVVECAHMLAAFSSVAVYDKRTFECLEHRVASILGAQTQSMTNLSRLHPSLQPRLKDVAKVLWAFAAVSHCAKKQSLQVSVQFLEQQFTSHKDLYHVLDALQSLICLNCFPWDLIDRATSPSAERAVLCSGKKKATLRLAFVAASAQLARGGAVLPASAPGRMPPPSGRDGFAELAAVFGAHGLRASCLLPHIRIAGVTFSVCLRSLHANSVLDLAELQRSTEFAGDLAPRLISMELLDESVLVRNSGRHLRGIMAAKVRQLHALGVCVIGVTPEEACRLAALPNERDWWNTFVRACAQGKPTPDGLGAVLDGYTA